MRELALSFIDFIDLYLLTVIERGVRLSICPHPSAPSSRSGEGEPDLRITDRTYAVGGFLVGCAYEKSPNTQKI